MPRSTALSTALSPYHSDSSESYSNPLGIVGNTSLLLRLEQDIREGHLSLAYIIDGKGGSGRHTIAMHIASALACHNRPNRGEWLDSDPDQISLDLFDAPVTQTPPDPHAPLPCGVCEGCRKVREGICPDVHFISRGGKATLGVDAVRHLRQDVHIGPGDMDTKLYIIEDAHTMTPQAQNALLLTLEEPPAYVVFLLLCDGADKLLETIRSRAPVLRTQPLDDASIAAFLKQKKISLPQEELSMLLQAADGCIGQALSLADTKSKNALLKQRELADAFISACVQRHPDKALAALYAFGNKREGVAEMLSLVTVAVRDLLVLQRSDSVTLRYYTHPDTASELAASTTPKALLSLYQAVDQAQTSLTHNASVRLTLTKLLMEAGILT